MNLTSPFQAGWWLRSRAGRDWASPAAYLTGPVSFHFWLTACPRATFVNSEDSTFGWNIFWKCSLVSHFFPKPQIFPPKMFFIWAQPIFQVSPFPATKSPNLNANSCGYPYRKTSGNPQLHLQLHKHGGMCELYYSAAFLGVQVQRSTDRHTLCGRAAGERHCQAVGASVR